MPSFSIALPVPPAPVSQSLTHFAFKELSFRLLPSENWPPTCPLTFNLKSEKS